MNLAGNPYPAGRRPDELGTSRDSNLIIPNASKAHYANRNRTIFDQANDHQEPSKGAVKSSLMGLDGDDEENMEDAAAREMALLNEGHATGALVG